MAKAQWTTKRTEIVAASKADGSFHAEVPLYDGAALQLTLTLDVTADRVVVVNVHGEPDAVLSGFQAWSDL
jgi:hypothetical protein